MPTDLDSRIRRAVVEVVDTAPAPPAFDELSAPVPRNRPVRRLLVVAIGAVTVVALAIGAAWFARVERSTAPPAAPIDNGVVRLELESLPQGVVARRYLGTDLLIARRGPEVRTFLADRQRGPEAHALWWCPGEGAFTGPNIDEIFNRDGHVVGGPARAGLDRLATRVLGRVVRIDLRHIVPDSTGRVDDNTIPEVTCSGAIKAGEEGVATFADIEALPTLEFTAAQYVVQPRGQQVEIRFVSRGGTHRLVVEGMGRRIQLDAAVDGEIRRVKLEPGSYEVFCAIPGHRAAGMDATLLVLDQ